MNTTRVRGKRTPLIIWAPVMNQYVCPGGNECTHSIDARSTHIGIVYAEYCTDVECPYLKYSALNYGATRHRGHKKAIRV